MSRHNQDVDKVRDVSSNSSERQPLLASEAPFRAIVESAAMGVALFDFGGAVIFTNRSLERFLGHDAETLRKRGVAGVSHPPAILAANGRASA